VSAARHARAGQRGAPAAFRFSARYGAVPANPTNEVEREARGSRQVP